MMNPALLMILALQRVAEILATADRGRHRSGRRDGSPIGVPPFRRLPDGSWIYRRRDLS
jgi:hypothetical protein